MEGRPVRALPLAASCWAAAGWARSGVPTTRQPIAIVALKVLPAKFADDETFQMRFRREAHAAAGLIEPHVVPIHDYGEIDGRLYVDMRADRGYATWRRSSADGPLDPARAVTIIEQVGARPQRRAQDRPGPSRRQAVQHPGRATLDFAYLIDFGIARAADRRPS